MMTTKPNDVATITNIFLTRSNNLIKQLLERCNTTVPILFDANRITRWFEDIKLSDKKIEAIMKGLEEDQAFVDEEDSPFPNIDIDVIPEQLFEYSDVKYALCELIAYSYIAGIIGRVISGRETSIIEAGATHIRLGRILWNL